MVIWPARLLGDPARPSRAEPSRAGPGRAGWRRLSYEQTNELGQRGRALVWDEAAPLWEPGEPHLPAGLATAPQMAASLHGQPARTGRTDTHGGHWTEELAEDGRWSRDRPAVLTGSGPEIGRCSLALVLRSAGAHWLWS